MLKRLVPVAVMALAGAAAHGQTCCKPAEGGQGCSTAQPVEAKPATLELLIEGMSCDRCAASINEALDDLEGVRRADISFSSGRGAVAYNAALTDAARIMEAVRAMKRPGGDGNYNAKRDLPSDRVSLFDVPLACTAAPEIGCGPVVKPLLSELEDQAGVSEAWLNRAGTALAIVWTEDVKQQQRDAAVRLLLAKGVNDATNEARPQEITGLQRETRLDEFLRLTGVWYRDTSIHALIEYEAQAIAERLARRVQAQVALDEATTQAVARALVDAAQVHMTKDLEVLKEWVQTRMNDDLLEAARPHLDDKGVAAMRKALEAGFRPLPGENAAGGNNCAGGAAAAPRQLNVWEPIDDAFRGCGGGCGTRVASPTKDVVAHPGVQLGQRTYCPVSGVVFQVQKSSPARSANGKPVYLCCAGCAAYFDANREHVIAARGLAAAMNSKVRIEVLGFGTCPNTPAIKANVEKAVAEMGLAAEIVYVDQEALQEDDGRRGWPTPTVLVDGRDLFGLPQPSGTAMGCRMYPGGAPSRAEIAEALKSVIGQPGNGR